MDLRSCGWNETHWEVLFRAHAPEGCRPARVIAQHKGKYRLATEAGEGWGEVAGKFHQSTRRSEFPTTGDFVAVNLAVGEGSAIIQAVLPRTTVFRRKAAGLKVEEQVVAANVDTAFIVSGLDGELNGRRLERYLTIAWDSGSQPVVLLNKADACDDTAARGKRLSSSPRARLCTSSAPIPGRGSMCWRPISPAAGRSPRLAPQASGSRR